MRQSTSVYTHKTVEAIDSKMLLRLSHSLGKNCNGRVIAAGEDQYGIGVAGSAGSGDLEFFLQALGIN